MRTLASVLVRFIDLQSDFIVQWFTPCRQMQAGVVMMNISFAYLAWWKFSGEPFGIFTMSVLALTFTGILCVLEGARHVEEDGK